MHGEDVARGQEKIHDAEDGFFHLAGVLGSTNEDDFAGEVAEDEGSGASAVALGDGFEFRSGDYGEFGYVGGELAEFGADEELFDEERMPGVFADDGDRELVGGVGSGGEVHHVEVALVHVAHDAIEERLEFLGREGLVDLAPVDGSFGEIIFDDEFVAGRAAGACSGKRDESAVGGETGLTARNCRLD